MNIKDFLNKKQIPYTENELGIHITGNLDLRGYAHEFKADQLASIGGYLDLRGYAHEFKADQLASIGGYLDLEGYAHEFKADQLASIGGYLDLEGYAHEFKADQLASIGGNLDLRGYAHEFKADQLASIGGYLYLEGYAHEFKADQLASIGGNLYLEGYAHEFKADQLASIGGYLYLDREMDIRLGGNSYKVVPIDNIGMVGIKWKIKDGIEYSKANYLKFPVLKPCYVARVNGYTAHGESLKDAISDAKYKALENSNKNDIVNAIKESNTVTLDQWRALTGACRSGTAEHLGVSVSELPESMPLDVALEKCKGSSFGDTFKNLIKGI